MKLPNPRTTDLLEQEADSDLLIYDLLNNKAFTLNETSKIVYKACGNLTFEDLKREYKFTDDLIYLTLDELSANGLIEDYQSDHFAGLSRREVIKKVGLATMAALPVIVGLTAPKAVRAASCINPGGRAMGVRVSASRVNQSDDTSTNQNEIATLLTAQCCVDSYYNFQSTGCSGGIGDTCFAFAFCN